MTAILEQLSYCVEKGRVNKDSTYPSDMRGLPGAVELTENALQSQISATRYFKSWVNAGNENCGR